MDKEVKECTICGKRHYALGFCRNHHAKFIRSGNPLGVYINKCQWEGCPSHTKNQYCSEHLLFIGIRIKNNLPLTTLPKDCHSIVRSKLMMKELNPRWNSGNSEYLDHADMKRARLIKLQQTNYTCEGCGIKGSRQKIHIHHKDLSKTNHDPANLEVLCPKCHKKKHSKHKRPARVD